MKPLSIVGRARRSIARGEDQKFLFDESEIRLRRPVRRLIPRARRS
jgi:hypothetical protein